MTEKAPVKTGEQFVSMRTGKVAVVEGVGRLRGTSSEWFARVLVNGTVRTTITCSKDGIKGYRRKACA